MRPLLVALTGSIGVGKSTVAKLLAERGAQIVSGDELGRRALEESAENLAAVRLRFGSDVFESDGTMRRRELGRRVFASAADAAWLTKLTFPAIHQLWREAVNGAIVPVVVFDAALIFEWGIEKEFDMIIVVVAAPDAVTRRLADEQRFSREEWEARRKVQVEAAAKRAKTDVVIQNDGGMSELRDRVDHLWHSNIEPRFRKDIRN